jgi:two-component system phosphate regulon sensor histidine kinase PhoR
VLRDKIRDSVQKERSTNSPVVFSESSSPDTSEFARSGLRKNKRVMQFLYDMESLQDSIKVHEIDTAYARRLQLQGIDVPFQISRLDGSIEREERMYNEVTIGFQNPITYKVQISDKTSYLLKRILAPILLSFFLVAFTIVSFSLLYRNLLRQRRLADIKNEFISNITHELKTPIATVSVAIEALRSFNANMDAQKTKEYLDISANELQRLSLLVDKVLKLSMFENREVELKYEPLDMKELVEEVTASMRLQAEKHKAIINVTTEGDTQFEGDRLHLVSVIFNLVDNALKYGNGSPNIKIGITGKENAIKLSITDNGIGVPPEYKEKIFEKFFRVPTGNLHNAKGYGLGLSYVAHVIEKHKGTINVESVEGNGSKFNIRLPKHNA